MVTKKSIFTDAEDLIFAKRTEKMFKRYEKGEFIEMDLDDFISKMDS